MTDYEKKEDHVLDHIAHAVLKLEDELTKLDALEEDDAKKHEIKKWYAEKKALHEIKRILHEAGKYDKYEEKELEQLDKYLDKLN